MTRRPARDLDLLFDTSAGMSKPTDRDRSGPVKTPQRYSTAKSEPRSRHFRRKRRRPMCNA